MRRMAGGGVNALSQEAGIWGHSRYLFSLQLSLPPLPLGSAKAQAGSALSVAHSPSGLWSARPLLISPVLFSLYADCFSHTSLLSREKADLVCILPANRGVPLLVPRGLSSLGGSGVNLGVFYFMLFVLAYGFRNSSWSMCVYISSISGLGTIPEAWFLDR